MSNNLVFFVPYHTSYARIELVLSFASFAIVHLFVYKWNPAQQLIQDYFARSTQVYVHKFSIDSIVLELDEQRRQQRKVVVLITATINYPFGQAQFRYFSDIKKRVLTIIDVY